MATPLLSDWHFQQSHRSWSSVCLQISPEPWASSSSRSLQLLPSRPLALTFFGKRRSKPIWEMLSVEEAGTVSRSARLYLTVYICSPTHLSQPWPRLPPPPPSAACPAPLSLHCPCSPCSSCAIVVWATGYFLLGAKDYSVIRNVCLSGRLRNKDYK